MKVVVRVENKVVRGPVKVVRIVAVDCSVMVDRTVVVVRKVDVVGCTNVVVKVVDTNRELTKVMIRVARTVVGTNCVVMEVVVPWRSVVVLIRPVITVFVLREVMNSAENVSTLLKCIARGRHVRG